MMRGASFYKNAMLRLLKSTALILFLLIRPNAGFAQVRPPFSEKTVEVDDGIFLPYTKGEVVRKISGPRKPALDKICAIITAWDSIAPPQGMKVQCSGFDHTLEVYFLPYLSEDGTRFASGGGPSVRIHVNDPRQMVGSPIAPDIYLCPQKRADFHGYPIYQNDDREVTIVYKRELPLFVAVSQEEYLKALVAEEEEEKAPKGSSPDSQTAVREMERAYQQLLKTDKVAATEFKQHMDEFRAEAGKSGDGANSMDPVALLKKELSGLTDEERKRQAWYGGASAMEAYHNASGLVPYEDRDNAEALVRTNPALIEAFSKDQVQLLVIRWSVGGTADSDKPRLYNEGRAGSNLADDLMSKLYLNQGIWSGIFEICNR